MAKFEVEMTRTIEFKKIFEIEAVDESTAEQEAQKKMEALMISELDEIEDDTTDIVRTEQIEWDLDEEDDEEEDLEEEDEDDAA